MHQYTPYVPTVFFIRIERKEFHDSSTIQCQDRSSSVTKLVFNISIKIIILHSYLTCFDCIV